jgi:hypothetical protein
VAIDDNIYIIGGATNSNHSNTDSLAVQRYNTTSKAITSRANILRPALYARGDAVDGKIYVFGGAKVNSTYSYSEYYGTDIQCYDPETDTWTYDERNSFIRIVDGSAVTLDGKIYLTGGRIVEQSGGTNIRPALIMVYDPSHSNTSLNILGDAVMQFDKDVWWNGILKPANTEFTTAGRGTLLFKKTGVSGVIREKIEQSITMNAL